ncbi:odorant receptor 10-like [Battus philenor]|uniref:odorant receptor 10-like n=1 Tax=Battus philenor TaxID=42288 RepID=UPI0035D0021E
MPPRVSRSFKLNFVFLNIFGIWPGNETRTYYKYYSAVFIFVSLFMYNVLLTLNLFYTPPRIGTVIREVVFYFTELAVTGKVIMILMERKKIVKVLSLLDCEYFQGENEHSREIIKDHIDKYSIYWKVYATLSNFAYFSQIFLPVISHFIFNTTLDLPICKYYFLSDQFIQRYFFYLFTYQTIWMYGHMTYNVNIDTLIAGLIFMAIAQLRVLNYNFKKFSTSVKKTDNNSKDMEMLKLNRYLMHYNTILSYCSEIQQILSISLFVQFGMASAVICVILFGLLLPTSIESLIFMISYFFAMVLQILVPAYLGSLLGIESQELVFAGYCCEWVPRSKEFKSSIKLFLTRANKNILITGLKVFPLSLDTFVWIMKTAYSLLALIRNVQNQQT